MSLGLRDLRLDPPRLRRAEPEWKRAWRKYRLMALTGTAAARLVRRRQPAPPPRGRFRLRDRARPRGRLEGLPAGGRGPDRRGDHHRQQGGAADQRRPDLPRLHRDDRVGGADAERADLRLLARRHRRRGGRGDLRARPRRACAATSSSTRSARRRCKRSLINDMRDAGVARDPLPTAEAVRDQAGGQPHPPPRARRRRARRA